MRIDKQHNHAVISAGISDCELGKFLPGQGAQALAGWAGHCWSLCLSQTPVDVALGDPKTSEVLPIPTFP